ncbi:MAG: hypothetical protein COB26_10275 [Piscirickettsiaceae bacterium]|nr:MAG: hypothetical protein COB26_10275 [Piscirickettsiaceae bacterium]
MVISRTFHLRSFINGRVLFLLTILLLIVPPAIAANTKKMDNHLARYWTDSVVQILAYKGDTLLNQGSGIVVATGGVVITSAHLLEYSDHIVIQGPKGINNNAIVVSKNDAVDLAILRSEGLNASPVKTSLNSVSQNDVLEIAGYWNLTAEKARGSFFDFSNRPKFVATVVNDKKFTKALLNGSGVVGGRYSLIASIGRGAYGGPVINRCGELLGIVRPKPNMSLKQLWQPHIPAGVEVIDISVITEQLSASKITVTAANKPCLSVLEQQTQSQIKKQAEINRAKKKIKQIKKQAEKEKEARKEAEKGRSDITEIVSEINTKAEKIGTENIEIKKENVTLLWSVVGVIATAFFIVLLLMLNKRKSSRIAKEALEIATASFGDCRFEGTDSSGAPIAFFVLGNDLMQRENGLIVGRNPDLSQVVIADDTVSREHARLFIKDNHLNIIDLGSTGGTRVNGQSIGLDGLIIISGDTVEFGEVRCTLSILGVSQ